MAFCRGCNARIEWHKTAAGKAIPLDPDPHPDGNITFDSAARVVYAAKGSKPRMYLSHFATCPKADEFRKAKAKPFKCDWTDLLQPCERKDQHRHCFECGETDHLAEDCPRGG
jgi:hypothetical protein